MRLLLNPVEVEVDEGAARRTLRDQIARLEGELGELALSAWPGPDAVAVTAAARPFVGLPAAGADPAPAGARQRVPAAAGAAVQTLAELEETRDALAARAAATRRTLDARGQRQQAALRAREEMLRDPHAHAFAQVSNGDVGDPGCGGWHVRPRFGLLGMLAGWWRVVVSSGCPLATEGATRAFTPSRHGVPQIG